MPACSGVFGYILTLSTSYMDIDGLLVVVDIADIAKQGGGNLTCGSLVCTLNDTFSSNHNYIVLFSYKVVTENLMSCYLTKICFWNFILVQVF